MVLPPSRSLTRETGTGIRFTDSDSDSCQCNLSLRLILVTLAVQVARIGFKTAVEQSNALGVPYLTLRA